MTVQGEDVVAGVSVRLQHSDPDGLAPGGCEDGRLGIATDDSIAEGIGEWEGLAAATVGSLRAEAARGPYDATSPS